MEVNRMNSQAAEQVIYRADPNIAAAVKKLREKAGIACRKCLNRHVRVQTISGQIYEGMIVNADEHHVYLNVAANQAHTRQFFPYGSPYYNPYYSTILPLVLYDLLVISLLF
jgi:hypothetical protein